MNMQNMFLRNSNTKPSISWKITRETTTQLYNKTQQLTNAFHIEFIIKFKKYWMKVKKASNSIYNHSQTGNTTYWSKGTTSHTTYRFCSAQCKILPCQDLWNWIRLLTTCPICSKKGHGVSKGSLWSNKKLFYSKFMWKNSILHVFELNHFLFFVSQCYVFDLLGFFVCPWTLIMANWLLIL
jgi:hypothetical protein